MTRKPVTPKRNLNSATANAAEPTRERILTAATSLIASQGYAATSIAQIAKASSTHHASIYWAFGSKEGLLSAVLDRCAQQYFETVQQSISPRATLREAVSSMSRPIRENVEFVRLLMILALERRDGDPQVIAAARRARETAIDLLEQKFRALPAIKARRSPKVANLLARHTLMIFDGLFIAGQIEPDEIDIDETLRFVALG